MMFGFTGANSAETIDRERGYMAGARARWFYLTHIDASTIKNERQLTIVKERWSLPEAGAEKEVRERQIGRVL